MTFRMCADIGGTFTDLVVVDEKGELNAFKAPSTPPNFSEGVFDALKLASEHYNMPLNRLLAECTSFVHGSTVATNAIIEGRVAKTGLICTRGFRDTLLIREGGKAEPFNWDLDYPEPYIPRYLTLPLTERVNAEGGIEIPLSEDDVREAIRQFKEWNVEAIAVSLMWSIANPVHEKRVGEIINEEWPEIPYVLSHEVNPIIREYRRTSSTAINTSLLPLVRRYTTDFEERLKGAGYSGVLSIITASGGVMTGEEISARPIYSVGSGPAMAPVAGRMFGSMERDTNDVIAIDMGGTSFDVSIVREGGIALSREALVMGYMLGISKADIRSIGAGGGSIAWVDPGGLIHVGPQSAGAVPGPACYGLGGEEPTVTDANLVLGYLNPDYFLGGRMKINPQSSERVIKERVAKPLKLDVPEAAFTMCGTVNHDMIAAIEDITVWQGIDPREYLVVVGGGAAGLHIVPIARELGMKEILVPRIAGVLSALGGVVADMRADFSGSRFIESYRFDFEGVNRVLEALEKEAEAFLARAGAGPENRSIEFYAEGRYPYQVWELEVPLRASRIKSEKELAQLVEDFHDVHERVFAIKEPGQYVEWVYWTARAIAKTPKVQVREQSYGGEDPSAAVKGKRKAYFRELGASLRHRFMRVIGWHMAIGSAHRRS